jgi:RNA polymerase sigma-54 factor
MTSLQSIAGAYQQQHVTPRLQQSVKLLLMSTLEFQQHMQQQLELNPFLDSDAEQLESLDAADGDSDVSSDVDVPESDDDERLTKSAPVSSGKVADWSAGRVSLQDHLLAQLTGVRVEDHQRLVIDAIVNDLDDDGYLRDGREELSAALGLPIDENDWNCALRMVQSLDPAGIGARDLRECLLLQLARESDGSGVLLARTLASEHFEVLAERDWPALAAATGASRVALREAVDRIRGLNPRPARDFSDTAVRFAVPDAYAVKRNGKWTATLNPAIVPPVRLNETYVHVVKQHRANCPELCDQLREARWTLKNIAQRLQTIEQVAEAIVARQGGFFDFGPIALKPMHLADIAQAIGVHESTVSRVTTGKYIATPFGTLELKYFFSRSLPACEKGPAATAIRRLIEETLHAEDRSAPLSDAEIARRLQRQGLTIARRTVTKYRQQMGIDAVEVRRLDHEFAAA